MKKKIDYFINLAMEQLGNEKHIYSSSAWCAIYVEDVQYDQMLKYGVKLPANDVGNKCRKREKKNLI